MNAQKSRQSRKRAALRMKQRLGTNTVSSTAFMELTEEMIREFIHEVRGEGSKPLMPVLFAIGQLAYESSHNRAINVQLREENANLQRLIDDYRIQKHLFEAVEPKDKPPFSSRERRGTVSPHFRYRGKIF